MGIKSTKGSEEAKPKYPYLGESKANKRVVLFCNKDCGTVIFQGRDTYPVGYYTATWDEKVYIPYTEKITLVNV